MWNETDLAYAAGIIDGEGCIYIDRYKDKRRNEEKNMNYVLRVKVAMTDLIAPAWLLKFGGSVRTYNYKTPKFKPIHIWTINSDKAIDFLSLIFPFIKIKKAQIETAIDFQKTKSGYCCRKSSSLNVIQFREQLAVKMRQLNQREAA